MSAKVEVLLKNVAQTTGEGPHWDERTNTLLHVDILNGGVHRWNSETNEDHSIHLDGNVSFVVPCKKNGYIIGQNRSFTHLDWDTKKTAVVADIDENEPNNRFNDGKCDAAGRIIAGTMAIETAPCVLELEKGSLYTLNTDKSAKHRLDKLSISNGIAWTSDNRTMFFIDSIPRKIWAFDYDLPSGDISNQRTVKDFGEGTEDTLGFPDGMTIDTEGKIWVACYSVGKVIRFDPNTGTELQTINFPAKRTTSCCFGGRNFDELYVTSSRVGLTDEEMQATDPLAGSVFKVTELGFKGYPANVFEGL